MNTRPHTIVLIILLVFSWKCGKVRVLEATMETWKQAVLDCYGNNSFLESNTTVLKQYMVNHNEVNDSIWVGSFLALLPWIEIRGCYNIPLTCNSFEIDERNATNLQLCQLKCMKRRYFAFNQKNKRCVCFDEHDVVKKETDNATFCQECTDSGDCNTHAVVYKVFDIPINLADTSHDCLSYQCNYTGAIPIFYTQECFEYSRSYCRDGRSADGPAYQNFFQYRFTCEENHFTYPLLYSENPVNLCNLSESLTPGRDVWVGVYRQKLYVDNSDNAVIQHFDQIEQYISRCDHLPANDEWAQAENCSGTHHYKCALDPDTGETDNQSSGMIVGIVVSISVIVVIIFVILAFMYRRTYAKENASLNTAGIEDLNTNDIDNNTVISDCQQLDNVDDVQKITNAYDQLNVTRNVHTGSTNNQANICFSREEYSKYESIVDSNGINTNTVISEYEEFHNADKDTSSQAYDQLNVTREVPTDPTDFVSKITVSTEIHSKNQSTKATAATSEYEQTVR